jgi:hypothetical protein
LATNTMKKTRSTNKKTLNIKMNSPIVFKITIELLFVLFISVSAFGQSIDPLEDDRNYKTSRGKVKKSNLVLKKASLRFSRNYKQPAQLDSVAVYHLALPGQESMKNRNYKNK